MNTGTGQCWGKQAERDLIAVGVVSLIFESLENATRSAFVIDPDGIYTVVNDAVDHVLMDMVGQKTLRKILDDWIWKYFGVEEIIPNSFSGSQIKPLSCYEPARPFSATGIYRSNHKT